MTSADGEALHKIDGIADWRVDEDDLAAMPRLRWFQSIAAGVDSVPLRAIADRGVIVTNTRGVHAPNISEHVLAMMLAFARGLPGLVLAQHRREWLDGDDRWRVFELAGQHVVVLGMGAIGSAVATKCTALGMRVTGVRTTAGGADSSGIDTVAFDQMRPLLASADHLVCTLPLTENTRGMVDDELLGSLKAGSFVYNVGRGAVIDTGSLQRQIQSGRLAGAGLDVTDPEPLPADSLLWTMPNVLITAHSSGATPHYWNRVARILTDNCHAWRVGAPLVNVVDPVRGY